MNSVSIIIPAYNAQNFIDGAVRSALDQTYPHCEIIVVDDGSTDRTPELLKNYGSRIRVIRQENAGTAAACNAGVAEASGDWIAFLDSDDEWCPEKLEHQIQSCKGFAISHTDSICFGEALPQEIRRSSIQTHYSGYVLEKLLVSNFITKSTVLVARDVYVQHGGFPDRFDAVEDWPLWLTICADHELGYVAEPLVRYRVHKQSKSMKARETDAAHLSIIRYAFSENGVGREHRALRGDAIHESAAINAHYAAITGDWLWATRCALRSLRYKPTDMRMWKVLAKSLLMPLGLQY